MVRILAAVLIIAAVLYLFGAGKTGKVLGGGVRLGGPSNSSSALPPGYRSEPPGGPATTSPTG